MVYSVNGVGKIRHIHARKKETRLPFYIVHKNKLKWVNNLNVRLETIKILEENMGSKILDISHNNIFFLIYLSGKENKRKK